MDAIKSGVKPFANLAEALRESESRFQFTQRMGVRPSLTSQEEFLRRVMRLGVDLSRMEQS